ncbi:hypothetical protein J7I93_02705 [Bacillus sp. ISL-47]|uniref:YqgU-like beta propeller domain-containing protein n=1 Tax=Bacillus sp. ISL-47 TaxID=2819130 RepID=UPI001BE6D1BB|nr:hypothetical protein [Bacillus sp. ISL-47]MBT2687088.1 hypothetical protein [Bacillus sp. ISL-47]MBT2707388.1 hypothetical protein [Pseudomonas sp. ISL-84]
MKNIQITYSYRFLFLFLFLLYHLIFIVGCENTEVTEIQPKSKQNQISEDSVPPADNKKDSIAPIKPIAGEFQGANGWLSNETIVYTVNNGTASSVYAYNLFTGEQNLLFESSVPIAAVTISPNGKYVLIRSSPGTYESTLTVVKGNGEILMNESLSSFDLAVEWNPYNEESLLVSSFTEDWDFSSWHMDIKADTLEEIKIREPFAKWLKNDQILFLGWDSESPSLFAPLIMQTINGDNETKVMENIFHFDASKNRVMAITVPSEKSEQAVYTFMDNNFRKLSSYTVPHLTRFSDWLVPYYDWSKDNLITFQPLYSAESDTYTGGFQLVAFDSKTGVKEVLMEGMENTPLSCSPDGLACLAGYYLEELIMLDSKEKVPILENKEI